MTQQCSACLAHRLAPAKLSLKNPNAILNLAPKVWLKKLNFFISPFVEIQFGFSTKTYVLDSEVYLPKRNSITILGLNIFL